jgi:hypothetical protein
MKARNQHLGLKKLSFYPLGQRPRLNLSKKKCSKNPSLGKNLGIKVQKTGKMDLEMSKISGDSKQY